MSILLNHVIIRISILALLFMSNRVFAQNYEFVNGSWFNGQSFEEKTLYVTESKLSLHKPGQIDSTIDLKNQYVIPPFGEAHNHNLESAWMLEQRIKNYLRDGVFYVKMQSSIKKRVESVKNILDKSPTVDITFAHAPLTATGGHPIRLREIFFDKGLFKGLFNSKKEIEGHGYHIINSEDDLEGKWSVILAGKPDFIKCNLLYSEEYELRKEDPAYFGKKGLNPYLLPKIVAKAHESGLRVSTHVNTAMDFHNAVIAGVDEINHLPARWEVNRIRDEDAKLAAEKGIVVVTTASLIKRLESAEPKKFEKIKENMKENLRTLREHNVTVAIGSDIWGDNSSQEAIFLKEMNVFTNLELLKMWAENSAKTIFPNRKIGELKEGFDASFLVLEGNPLDNFNNVQRIKMRVKQGQILDISTKEKNS